MAKMLTKSQKSELEFTIQKISELSSIWSEEVFVYGIPWRIQACKNQDENSLALYLQCAKKDDPTNWEIPATASFHLIPFDSGKNAHTSYISPYVFNPIGFSFGVPVFIDWDELMKDENKFVENDTIQLKTKITAENLNYVDRAVLKLDTIDKSCDCGSLGTFHLRIKNVKNLLAVHSPKFILRGFPWDFTVYKDVPSTLGVMLETKKSTKKQSCTMTMSVKLVSSKDGVEPIEKSITDEVEWPGNIEIPNVLPWDELVKPENGFINNHSVTLEVELKAGKTEKELQRQLKNLKRRYSSV